MGRASTLTKLPLDTWAKIIGYNPFHFNGVYTALLPDVTCNSDEGGWMQYAWQDASKVSREDLAEAIAEAEAMIENYIGYYLLPTWTIDERRVTERPAIRELFSGGVNIRNMAKSVKAYKAHAISGGQRAKSVISAGAAIVRSDANGDGYNELCTVTVASTVDIDEVRVYFPGESGADEWEIRPVKVVASGANLVITFGIQLAVDPDLWEAFNATGIDGDTAANFVTTVDVYRVYNDPQSQLQLLWEPDALGNCGCGDASCAVCTFAAQDGCLHIRDSRLGILAYSPAAWNITESAFDNASYAVWRDPDRLRLWYYSGNVWGTDDPRYRPTVDMEPYWQKAVAYLAAALLERQVCACNNVEKFIDYYREDLARSGSEVSYQNLPDQLGNAFGTRRGAVYAWQRANQEGRRIV